ncbi:hypothetical protein EMIHUDRAFT_55825, partial [Emiliania huxleyi CCMP1516]
VAAIEFAILVRPRSFAWWYVGFILPLLGLRLWIYSRLRWHYFLIDFCYMANVSCLVQVLAYPQLQPLVVANFAHASGPLALAIITWRNSLVFHSLDKITSVFIHALPALLLFCTRWYPPAGLELPDSISAWTTMRLGVLSYGAWQLFYVLVTEALFARALHDDPALMTSIRWLTSPGSNGDYSGLTRMFDADRWKTKLIFIAVQLLYTCVALLPVPLLWSHYWLHLAYLLGIYLACVWNGSSYYIEVFSKAY